MEPTASDVNAVAQHLGQQPAPQPTPAPQPAPQPVEQPVAQPEFTPGVAQPQYQPQQQPAEPTPQPAPTSQPQDPFSTLFNQPEPQQPTEQTPQPTPQPVEPQPVVQQQAPTPQTDEEQYMSFEDYMNGITQGVGQAPDLPDASQIDPTDEEGIKGFFDELVNTAVTRARQENARSMAIQNSERQLWDGAFNKYGSLRDNKNLRDMVHAIRMGEFKKGLAITPTQAADRLLSALQQQYKQGVADNQVVTTIESVQPNGGGSQTVETTTDMNNVYQRVQVGGEVALADYLDSQIKAGKL